MAAVRGAPGEGEPRAGAVAGPCFLGAGPDGGLHGGGPEGGTGGVGEVQGAVRVQVPWFGSGLVGEFWVAIALLRLSGGALAVFAEHESDGAVYSRGEVRYESAVPQLSPAGSGVRALVLGGAASRGEGGGA